MILPVKTRVKQISKDELFQFNKQEEVITYCQNCSNYKKNHSCPDFAFDAESLLAPFTHATIILTEIDTEPIRENWDQMEASMFSSRILTNYANKKKKEMPLASIISMYAFEAVKNEMADRLLELENAFEPAFSLPPGSCTRCEVCTKEQGKSCRYPDKLRYSLEALGFLVSEIYKEHFQMELGWAAGELPECFCTCSVLMSDKEIDETWLMKRLGDMKLEIMTQTI